MFPQFGATAETLSKASTMVFWIGIDAHPYDNSDDIVNSIRRSVRLLSDFSLSSLKASTSPITSLRRPNEALLSINCFQKDLGDPNPLVRAWALRTMAGIRLHVIEPLVLVAVGKCARDPSVYVRKCAASALPNVHDLRLEEHTSAIEEVHLINLFLHGYFCFHVIHHLL
uniref:Clathrin/coatomer adaptor adaptin-like N-terminal domain-containing protein n=1 Tax=Gossypium raimondii TaxID=29730 RepID=A0A0D2QK62_GOSRA|nr:hypothetical protein B456_003G132900 [Gossypium raimondii]